jgi:enhancing lycopene biosynthesis protein 2
MQKHVIDHQTSEAIDQGERNILVESARISRGNMKSLDDVSVQELDGLILPGGFGAAKNLIDYAMNGRDCTILPGVKKLIEEIVNAGKPLGAMCIAPVVVAVACRGGVIQPLLTIGNDEATAADIEFFGAVHQAQPVDGIAVDEAHRIVTTPAYMLGPGISDIAKGIEKLVKQVMTWAT